MIFSYGFLCLFICLSFFFFLDKEFIYIHKVRLAEIQTCFFESEGGGFAVFFKAILVIPKDSPFKSFQFLQEGNI